MSPRLLPALLCASALLPALPRGAPAAACAPGQSPGDDPFGGQACSPLRQGALTPVAGSGLVEGAGFSGRPRCPKGSRPVATPGQLQAWRCAPERPPADPVEEKVLARDAPAASPASASSRLPATYRRHSVPGGLQVELPAEWHLTDARSDAVPTLYASHDPGGGGRAVSLVVSKNAPAQEGYLAMEAAIAREKQWNAASELPAARVAGRKARLVEAAGESRTAFLAAPGGGYYILSYSAPGPLYESYAPVFDRVLRSARLDAVAEVR